MSAVDGCERDPRFGINTLTIGQTDVKLIIKATHCSEHKSDDMIQGDTTICHTCMSDSASSVFKPQCSRCYSFQNPNDKRVKHRKVKEHAFMVPLKQIFPKMIHDKTVEGGCSRRRPDGFIECGTHVVIVEIDEDQHIGYNVTCENFRMTQLYRDVAYRPIIFVRLNPDGYKNEDGKKINSAFMITKTGESKKRSEREFNRRFDMLHAAVNSAIHNIPSKAITIIHLCFTKND